MRRAFPYLYAVRDVRDVLTTRLTYMYTPVLCIIASYVCSVMRACAVRHHVILMFIFYVAARVI